MPKSPVADKYAQEYNEDGVKAHTHDGAPGDIEAISSKSDLVDNRSWFNRILGNSWAQITLVSFACFCLPGMYNAISGMGGSGQVDPTVSFWTAVLN